MTATSTPIEALLKQESWARRLAWDLARGDGALADDLVQGAYEAALTRPPTQDVPVRRWFAKVMRNLARRDRRGQANRNAVERRYALERRHEDAAANAIAVLEIRRQLQGLIEELPEPYRTRITERYVEGLKPRQIVARAGVSVETVKSQLVRGRMLLRAALDRQSAGDSSKWMAALAPLLQDRKGIAGAFEGQSPVAGLAASAAIVAAVILVTRHISSTTGAQAAAAGPLATAALDEVQGMRQGVVYSTAGLRRVAATVASEVVAVAAPSEAKPAPGGTTLWNVCDGYHRRGVAWSEAGTELVVVNYSLQQVEIWSTDGRMIASSTSDLHLSEIELLGDTIWVTHPGGLLAGLQRVTLEWGPRIEVGDPSGQWLTNGLGIDRFGRIHVARAGDGTVQVFDSRGGRHVGQWKGVPNDVQYLAISSHSFAIGYNQLDATAVVAIGTGYSEDLDSFEHRPAIRLNGGLSDVKYLADESLVCLVEAQGFLRFQKGAGADIDHWTLAGFMPLPEYGPQEPMNRVEKLAFGGPSERLLAMGRWSGLTVREAGTWESHGPAFDSAREVVLSATPEANRPK